MDTQNLLENAEERPAPSPSGGPPSAFRTITLWVLGLPATLTLFTLVLIAFPFGLRDLIHSMGSVWSRVLLSLAGVKVTVRGLENIPKGRAAVFASNHQGAFDIPVLQGLLPVQFRWVAKKSLFSVPVLGWMMTMAGYVPIERENPAEAYKSIQEASVRIKSGSSVLIFPEGTRSETGRLLPFKRGAFALATESGAAVVPVAISGTAGILKKGGFLITPSRVELKVLDPIESAGVDEKRLRNLTRNAIEAAIRERAKVIDG